jgi:isoquinoline 1-oxidoreductase subunit beta
MTLEEQNVDQEIDISIEDQDQEILTTDLSELEELAELDTDVSRRGFIMGTAGLTFGISMAGWLTAKSSEVLAASGKSQVTAWVSIGADNSVVIMSPAAEMGQGISTGLPMILAEELDADWANVSVVQAPPIPKIFGNPGFGGGVITVASRSTSGYWDKVRLAGAQARKVLLNSAAAKWKVPVGELSTGPSVIMHKKSGRKLSYGDVAAFTKMPKVLPKVGKSDLKKTADYRIIGQPVPRVDIPEKARGAFEYGMDVQVPGMMYAAIARTPVDGANVKSVMDAKAKKVAGVTGVFKLRDAVAVVGTSVEATQKAKNLLEIVWTEGKPAGFNSVKAASEYVARGQNLADKGLDYEKVGDAPAAIKSAAKVYKADYQSDYTYHAQMEPMNVTAKVSPDGKGAELWLGTQAPGLAMFVASKILKTKIPMIRVHQKGLGGGFGRRIYPDLLAYGLVLSKITKKPIKVIWSREDDVAAGKLRPMSAHHIEAGVDKDGKIVGWHQRIVAESVIGYTGPPQRLKKLKGLDTLTLEGAKTLYTMPNKSVEYVRENRNAALAAWRAIGSGYNKFVIESFIDEIAHDQGKDPIEYRLSMLSDQRSRHVIEEVAKMAGWGTKRKDRYLGLSYVDIWRTRTAGIIEISLDKKTGVVKTHNFWSAVDPGVVINPDTVIAQTESNVIHGIGQSLKERITFSDGAIEQSNFHDYHLMRMQDTPEIHTKVITTDNNPTGMGEIALPMIGGAISNAIFAASGIRMRHMPFTPERVLAALKA